MKKLLITAAALAMLTAPSFALDKNKSETEKMRFEMRMQFMKMSDDMINSQMAMIKMHEAMLSNYQRILKQMMENESSSHGGGN